MWVQMEHIILEILCVSWNSQDRIFLNTQNLSVTYHSFLRLFYIHTINHTYRSHIGTHISLTPVYKINIVRLSYYITFTRYYVGFVRTFDVQTAGTTSNDTPFTRSQQLKRQGRRKGERERSIRVDDPKYVFTDPEQLGLAWALP